MSNETPTFVDEEHYLLRVQLEDGWLWLKEHPDHSKHADFFDRWLEKLRYYERMYDMDRDAVGGIAVEGGITASVIAGRQEKHSPFKGLDAQGIKKGTK